MSYKLHVELVDLIHNEFSTILVLQFLISHNYCIVIVLVGLWYCTSQDLVALAYYRVVWLEQNR